MGLDEGTLYLVYRLLEDVSFALSSMVSIDDSIILVLALKDKMRKLLEFDK